MLVFELCCRTTEDECIDAWSICGIESAIEVLEISLLITGRVIVWSMMDCSAEVELQPCACHGDNPCNEPPFYGNDDQLWIVSVPMLKLESGHQTLPFYKTRRNQHTDTRLEGVRTETNITELHQTYSE